MKKLALVLGSLLVVGSVASAKEVMPAPTPAPEKVVEYVEKPVIVYRDREVAPAWRPNGSVDVQYRWYGEVENKNPKEDKTGNWVPDSKVNAGRLQTNVKINFTEKQSLEVRTRNYQTLNDNEETNQKSVGASDEYRIRHYYNFGKLGSSKVNATSRLEYKQKSNDGGKHVEASVFFDFADYIYSSNFFKADKFGFRTGYIHDWNGHGNDLPGTDGVNVIQKFPYGSTNKYILNFESEYTLPWGFSAEFNVYGGYDRHREYFAVYSDSSNTAGRSKGQFYTEVEAYLYQHTPLYKTNNFELSFDFEGGYDPYTWYQRKVVDGSRQTGTTYDLTNRTSYEVYMLPTLQVSYKPTEFVKLYAAAGAEYRNWVVTHGSGAKNWRWQPTAWAGMKVTF